MPTKNIKGYAFEWFVRKILNQCGFESVKPDSRIIFKQGRNLMVHGLGQPHNTDVLVNPPIQIPFFFPSRLIVECKCKDKELGIEYGRNVLGLREDINGFDIVTPDILDARKNYRRTRTAIENFDRYYYQVALASTSGFKLTTQEFAAVQRIPLFQFKSVMFRGIVRLIYKLDNLALNSYEKEILLNSFASGDAIQFVASNCTPDVRQWMETFSNECEHIANRMNIGVLDNGSILFLYKPEAPDIDECSDFQDGYSLHWAENEKFWVLRYGREAKYYFELPAELIDIWANKYKTNMRESALRLKEEYLKSIAVYTKGGDGRVGIDILTLSPTFINAALSSYRNTEINQ